VPIAGLITFLIVRAVGSSAGEAPKPPEPSDPTPAAVAPTEPASAGAGLPEVATPKPEAKQAPVSEPPVQEPVKQPAVKELSVTKEPVRPPVTAPPVKKKDPPAKARLHLTILGAGSRTDILVDGGASTPDSMVTLGSHVVEVHARGMVPQRFTVEVDKGGTTHRVELKPKSPKPIPDDDHALVRPGSLTPKKK
jgi:hypothetical protein